MIYASRSCVLSVVIFVSPLWATFFETQGLETGDVHSKCVLRGLSLPLLWYPGNCFSYCVENAVVFMNSFEVPIYPRYTE